MATLEDNGMSTPTTKSGAYFGTAGHSKRFLISSPAHPPGDADLVMTPISGPQASSEAEHCLALAPLLCETPEPHVLEFRSATKLKERRKQRQLARSPYARPREGTGGGSGSGNTGARRKLLEEEQQRLLTLPRGEVSRPLVNRHEIPNRIVCLSCAQVLAACRLQSVFFALLCILPHECTSSCPHTAYHFRLTTSSHPK